MTDFDEIKLYLPKYLSPESTEHLFKEIESFVEKTHDRIYSGILEGDEGVLQGDALESMPIINLPDEKIVEGPVLVLSNTCVLDANNKRVESPRVNYCPIVKISSLIERWEKRGIARARIDHTLSSIRDQEAFSMFYLPKGGHLPEECVALLDRMNNCDSKSLPVVNNSKSRLFSLGQFGHYLFLFKLSVHVTRIQESVERG